MDASPDQLCVFLHSSPIYNTTFALMIEPDRRPGSNLANGPASPCKDAQDALKLMLMLY